MKRSKWIDGDGREHVRYVVRSLGPGRGFGILDVLRNWFVADCFSTRENAREALREYEEELEESGG